MSNYDWPVSMLEGYKVPAETMMFFQSIWDESGEKSEKLDDLYNEHEILKVTCAKQERYIEELEKQLCILQKTLELVDKNKPRSIVKSKKVSREELIDLQNSPVIFNTEDEHIVHVCQDRWIPVTERLPESKTKILVYGGNDLIWVNGVNKPVPSVYMGYMRGEDERWFTWDEQKYIVNVTHWMPLPEPPKGE